MCTGRGSNQGPLGPKSDALTTAPLRHLFLAHLSRRLIGELIGYEGIRRPSVRPSSVVRLSRFSNDIFSEAVRPIFFIFHIIIASIGRGNEKLCFLFRSD